MRIPLRRIGHLLAGALLLTNLVLITAWPWLHGSVLGQALRPIFAELCHQLPERSYVLAGESLPVCARCLGVWFGLCVLALSAGLGVSCPRVWRPRVVLALLGWMFLSWLLGVLLLPSTWRVERTLAGVAGGVGLYALLCKGPSWLGGLSLHLRRFGTGRSSE